MQKYNSVDIWIRIWYRHLYVLFILNPTLVRNSYFWACSNSSFEYILKHHTDNQDTLCEARGVSFAQGVSLIVLEKEIEKDVNWLCKFKETSWLLLVIYIVLWTFQKQKFIFTSKDALGFYFICISMLCIFWSSQA